MIKPFTKDKKLPKWYFSILICSMIMMLLNCDDDGYNKNKSDANYIYSAVLLAQSAKPVIPAVLEENLPQPAINTAEMTIGDTKYTKTMGVCRGNLGANGNDNIMVAGNDASLPSFYLHKVDFTATNVFLSAAATFVFNVDMPTGGGYDPASTCEAKIIENSATIYDLQVKNCAVDKILGAVTPATNTISFRVRCTKGL